MLFLQKKNESYPEEPPKSILLKNQERKIDILLPLERESAVEN